MPDQFQILVISLLKKHISCICPEKRLSLVHCGWIKQTCPNTATQRTVLLTLLTCLVSLPASEVWSSEPCHPSWSHPASPPGTELLRWVHLSVCGRSESDQLVTPSLSSRNSMKRRGGQARTVCKARAKLTANAS